MGTKYTFKQEYGGFDIHHYGSPPSTVTMEIDGDLNLAQLLERFEDFLRGSGFQFDGHLDFVNDEENTEELTLEFPDGTEETVTVTHSDYYYDTDRNK